MKESKQNNDQLPYDFDLWFDIKTHKDLRREIKRLEKEAKNLSILKDLCMQHGIEIQKRGKNKQ